MSAYKTITSDNVTVGTTLTFPNRCTLNNLPTGGSQQVLTSNVSGLPVYGNINGNNIGGGNNEQSMWTIAGVSAWQNRSFRFGIASARFTAQDWNSASTVALTYTSISLSGTSFGTSAYTNITNQVAGSSFLINTSGNYRVSMYCCLTNGGLGTSVVRFNVLVNGVVSGGGPLIQLGLGEVGCLTADFPIALTATNVVSFQATRVSGTDSITADATNNSISIQLIQTLA